MDLISQSPPQLNQISHTTKFNYYVSNDFIISMLQVGTNLKTMIFTQQKCFQVNITHVNGDRFWQIKWNMKRFVFRTFL